MRPEVFDLWAMLAAGFGAGFIMGGLFVTLWRNRMYR
jgi:hypothetical protein